MRTVPRPRRYIPAGALTLCRPVFSFDYAREAYVLRGIGHHVGPVLRENRRRGPGPTRYKGPERRASDQTSRHGAPTASAARRGPTPTSGTTRSAGSGGSARAKAQPKASSRNGSGTRTTARGKGTAKSRRRSKRSRG